MSDPRVFAPTCRSCGKPRSAWPHDLRCFECWRKARGYEMPTEVPRLYAKTDKRADKRMKWPQ